MAQSRKRQPVEFYCRTVSLAFQQVFTWTTDNDFRRKCYDDLKVVDSQEAYFKIYEKLVDRKVNKRIRLGK
jgi:hypothetical protein